MMHAATAAAALERIASQSDRETAAGMSTVARGTRWPAADRWSLGNAL